MYFVKFKIYLHKETLTCSTQWRQTEINKIFCSLEILQHPYIN